MLLFVFYECTKFCAPMAVNNFLTVKILTDPENVIWSNTFAIYKNNSWSLAVNQITNHLNKLKCK